MPSGLRPLTTLEVLDAAWLVLRRNWAALYVSSGVGTVPLAVALMWYFYWLGTLVVGTEDSLFYTGTAIWALGMAAAWTLNSLARGAVTAIVLGETRGEEVSLGAAWRQAFRTAPSGIFAGLIGFAAPWLASGCLIAPGLLLALGWWVARPVTMTEGKPFGAALRRSWKLTDGYRGKAFGLWLLSAGLWLFAGLNLHLMTHFVIGTAATTLGLDTGALMPHLGWKNQAYATVVLAFAFVLIDPLKTCIDALLYVDLRIRREGADLEERLRALRSKAALTTLLLVVALGLAAPVRAASLDAYAKRVRTLRAQVEGAKKPAQVDPTAVAELRSQLVELPGGQKLSVRNEWLRDDVDGWKTPEDKAALLRRLDALERSLGAAPAPASKPATPDPAAIDTKQTLKGILAAPEFQPLADRNELRDLVGKIDLRGTKTWWQSFWDWVQKNFFAPPKAPPAPKPVRPWKGSELVVWVLLGVMVLVLLAMLVKWFLERPATEEARTAARAGDAPPPLEASATENALDHTVDEWELFAQQWLGRGDVRQAVRALYLATLVHLHRERRIDYNRAFTNWIYVRQFRGESEQKDTLRGLTRVFDEVWYGERPCGEEQYRAFEQGVRTLGTPAPTGGR